VKALTLSLSLAVVLVLGCNGSSITEPSLDSQDAGQLVPAGSKCNPDAVPC